MLEQARRNDLLTDIDAAPFDVEDDRRPCLSSSQDDAMLMPCPDRIGTRHCDQAHRELFRNHFLVER